jgi:hypothetical protein
MDDLAWQTIEEVTTPVQTWKEHARDVNGTGGRGSGLCVCPEPAQHQLDLHCRRRGVSLSRHRSRGRRQHHQWSAFGGLLLIQSEVTKSLAPPADYDAF